MGVLVSVWRSRTLDLEIPVSFALNTTVEESTRNAHPRPLASRCVFPFLLSGGCQPSVPAKASSKYGILVEEDLKLKWIFTPTGTEGTPVHCKHRQTQGRTPLTTSNTYTLTYSYNTSTPTIPISIRLLLQYSYQYIHTCGTHSHTPTPTIPAHHHPNYYYAKHLYLTPTYIPTPTLSSHT